MKSSIGLYIKFLIITIVGITIPQLALLTMFLIEPLWVFFETGVLPFTIFLFLIYHIVFSMRLGTKSYRYLKKVYIAIIMFIILNFCHFLYFYFVLYIYTKKVTTDPFGVLTILLIAFSLMIISILIFSITSIFAKSNFKKTFIVNQTENDSI